MYDMSNILLSILALLLVTAGTKIVFAISQGTTKAIDIHGQPQAAPTAPAT
jgi:hypothetical protein